MSGNTLRTRAVQRWQNPTGVTITQPLLFLCPVLLLLPVESERYEYFSQCRHALWLLDRKWGQKNQLAQTLAGPRGRVELGCIPAAVTLMKAEFSTASWTRSKRTWGRPSF